MLISNDDVLIHHGRKGQQWGITNGPPYPLGATNKDYHVKQTVNKVKQFMYDRFSEYGKDHQAVRDRYISQYRKKGYNETASQILAEQKYQAMDKALVKAGAFAIGGLIAGGLGSIGVGKIIQSGGAYYVKTMIGKKISEGMTALMPNIDMSQIASSAMSAKITPEMITAAVKTLR